MSQPASPSDRPRGVLVRRQRTSIYTVLLFIALMALVIGSLIMAFELLQYGLQFKPPTTMGSATRAAAAHDVFV